MQLARGSLHHWESSRGSKARADVPQTESIHADILAKPDLHPDLRKVTYFVAYFFLYEVCCVYLYSHPP
jgi:hypothetical protein